LSDINKEEANECPNPEIEQKVKQIIVDELGVDENEVTPNARLSMTLARTRSTPSSW